jgi:hypothetical protein
VTSADITAHETRADPQKASNPVPTLEHRALYEMIAALSLVELEPVYDLVSRQLARHFAREPHARAEGDS